MTRPIFDGRMMERLTDFYSSVCTIQSPTETQDAVSGSYTTTWGDVVGLVALPCALAPNGGVEVKQTDQTYVISNYTLSLRSFHPEIKEKWQAIVDAITYEILLVQAGSMGGITRVLVRRVE
jgi:hypothetical protein